MVRPNSQPEAFGRAEQIVRPGRGPHRDPRRGRAPPEHACVAPALGDPPRPHGRQLRMRSSCSTATIGTWRTSTTSRSSIRLNERRAPSAGFRRRGSASRSTSSPSITPASRVDIKLLPGFGFPLPTPTSGQSSGNRVCLAERPHLGGALFCDALQRADRRLLGPELTTEPTGPAGRRELQRRLVRRAHRRLRPTRARTD